MPHAKQNEDKVGKYLEHVRGDVSSVTLGVTTHRVERAILRHAVVVHVVLVLKDLVIVCLTPAVP